MEQPQETAAESKTQRDRRFSLKTERGIVESELVHTGSQLFIVAGFNRIDARKDHRVDLLETGQWITGGHFSEGKGVADLNFGGILDVGDDVAHGPLVQLLALRHLGNEDTDFLDFVVLLRAHHAHFVACLQSTAEHAHVDDDAAKGVIFRVEHEGTGKMVLGRFRRRDARHHGLQHLLDADALLGADLQGLGGLDGEDILDLLTHLINIRVGHLYLVEHGNDIEPVLHGQMSV